MGLLENKNYDKLRCVISEYIYATDATQIKKYCSDPILDVVLSS